MASTERHPWRPWIALALLGVVPDVSPAQEPSAAEALDRLFEDTFEEQLALDPSLATRIGDRRFQGRMTVAISGEFRQGQRKLWERSLAALGTIDRAALDPDRQTWYDAFRATAQDGLEELDYPGHLLPLVPGLGFHVEFVRMGAGAGDLTFAEVADYDAFLGRVADFERWVEVAIANLRGGMERGIVHPRSVVERTLGDLRSQLGRLEDSDFYRPIRDMPATFTAAERDRLRAAWTRAIEDRVLPAYRRLHDFLAKTYLPASRETIGLGALPGGREWYAALVRHSTTTEMTPDEVFALGEREVEAIRAEIRALERRGDLGLRGERTSDDVRVFARFASIEAQVRERLPKLFGRLPRAGFEVRRVEPFRAATSPGAFYEPPSGGGERPGVFYVNLDRGSFALGTAEVLFLHEALPGHHFQLALTQEREDLPRFLRFGFFGAFVEGWGLYCESLGARLGLYHDPAQQHGRLRYALGRASRLIADVGIHHKGWTRSEAERYLRSRNLMWAVSEIDRYVALPGQALSYKVGELRILELRRRAERALGKRFDLAAFHDLVLADGALPLDVLEAKVERWIRERS